MSNGRKYDGGKAPMGQGLLAYFPEALGEVAHVSRYGKEKYETAYVERNWAKVEDGEQRYLDAALRHITAHLTGQTYDVESGHPHLAHAAWSILAAREIGLATLRERVTMRDRVIEPESIPSERGQREMSMQGASRERWVHLGMGDAVRSSR